MHRVIVAGISFIALIAIPAFAQNCVSYQCYYPPPYDCAECGTYIYNGYSSCEVGFSGGGCNLGGYCDTGMGDDCPPEDNCLPIWVRLVKPRPLNEEWSLVRATVRPQSRRQRQS